MRLLADDGDLIPALPLCAGYDADRQPGGFEDRPLLDMRLEIGGDRAAADRRRAGKADALQFRAEGQRSTLLSGVARAAERSKTPVKAPEPTIAGENREPSSLVQATISIGASVS